MRPLPAGASLPRELEDGLRRLATAPSGPEREALREEAITALVPLARRIAQRFRARGVPLEDLRQVACLGLVHAVDRYRPERGHPFLSFAVPSIVGELKRYFRDLAWDVHVPRHAQEVCLTVWRAQSELEQANGGRRPTTAELVAHTRLPRSDVLLALEVGGAYDAVSLDTPTGPDERTPGERLGGPDPAIDALVNRVSLRPLIARLPEREREILLLYFFDELTQQEVALKLGISQMHVSRLLRRACTFLRDGLLNDMRPARCPPGA